MPAPGEGLLRFRRDLGVRASARGWKALLSREALRQDVGQGVLLAASTLPLSLLLASFSGVPASSALLSGAVGTTFCVLFGGTRGALSGAGLTSALATSTILAQRGPAALTTTLLAAGALQIGTGALGLGRFFRLLPLSVLRACVFGMGLLMLLEHVPNVQHVLTSDPASAHGSPPTPAAILVAVASGLLGALGFVRSWFPGSLLAVVGATFVSARLGVAMPTVSEVPSLPLPRLPMLPTKEFVPLLGGIIQVWAIVTFGAAIHTAATERLKIDRGDLVRNDTDQELIGNGMATLALAFLQAPPSSPIVARSALGVRLGVMSRRPALVQALLLFVGGLIVWPFLHRVPLAALTGIAVYVALPLLDPRPLVDLWRISRLELWIALATVLTMVFLGTLTGLLVGVGLAFGTTALRMTRTRAIVQPSTGTQAPHQVGFSGPVTFLAALEIDDLQARLAALSPGPGLVLDLRNVVAMDGNGAMALVTVLDAWKARGGKVAVLGPSALVRQKLEQADAVARPLDASRAIGTLQSAMAQTDGDAATILGSSGIQLSRARLLAGLERFKEEARDHYDSLLAHLAAGQHPHTMFVTCADSRIDPAILMRTNPGDLFVLRTLGALVPAAGSDGQEQEGAAVEYGVGILGIRTIVVCTHSRCGAISALKKGGIPGELVTLGAWSKRAAISAGEVASFPDADAAAKTIAVRQIQNLLTYTLVREAHARGDLELLAWFYDLGEVQIAEWSAEREDFIPLEALSGS